MEAGSYESQQQQQDDDLRERKGSSPNTYNNAKQMEWMDGWMDGRVGEGCAMRRDDEEMRKRDGEHENRRGYDMINNSNSNSSRRIKMERTERERGIGARHLGHDLMRKAENK